MVPRDGRPFSEHVATAASIALDKTSLLRHHPGVSVFSWPYKREGRGIYEGEDTRQNKSSPYYRRSTSQAISLVLSL
jgi:hypothetical protein